MLSFSDWIIKYAIFEEHSPSCVVYFRFSGTLFPVSMIDGEIAIFKIMFRFTFVSDHNTDYIMLYSVQLKNMYSYLNSSLKLSDIVRGLSCQQSYCNLLSLYKLIIIISFILSYKILLFPSTSCLVKYNLTLMTHKG